MDLKLIALVVVAVIGIFLIGNGFTGLVISQSCCFAPDCPHEYICDSAHLEESGAPQTLALGSLLALISISYIIITILIRKDKGF